MKLPNIFPRKRSQRVLLFLGMGILLIFNLYIIFRPNHEYKTDPNLKLITNDELKKHDGTISGNPIYLGYEGLVYDVSSGANFYDTNGPYHYLAGRDSTTELHIAGGAIIKSKYKVIGRLY